MMKTCTVECFLFPIYYISMPNHTFPQNVDGIISPKYPFFGEKLLLYGLGKGEAELEQPARLKLDIVGEAYFFGIV